MPIVGILLAAGRGSRFGSDKLLHPLSDGTPMALAAATHLLPACDRVMAVVRPGDEELSERLAATGCEIIYNFVADTGMGLSLAAGVRAAPDAAGWLVALADMPYITSASHQAVASRLRGGASLVASEYRGQRGHPVGFARQWMPQLVELSGDKGAKSILQANMQELLLCPVDDPGVVWDIDRPEDLHQAFSAIPAAPNS